MDSEDMSDKKRKRKASDIDNDTKKLRWLELGFEIKNILQKINTLEDLTDDSDVNRTAFQQCYTKFSEFMSSITSVITTTARSTSSSLSSQVPAAESDCLPDREM